MVAAIRRSMSACECWQVPCKEMKAYITCGAVAVVAVVAVLVVVCVVIVAVLVQERHGRSPAEAQERAWRWQRGAPALLWKISEMKACMSVQACPCLQLPCARVHEQIRLCACVVAAIRRCMSACDSWQIPHKEMKAYMSVPVCPCLQMPCARVPVCMRK